MGRYVEWDFEAGSVYCGEIRPGYRAYCHPDNFKDATNILYHQRADGSFEDVSVKAGIANPAAKLWALRSPILITTVGRHLRRQRQRATVALSQQR